MSPIPILNSLVEPSAGTVPVSSTLEGALVTGADYRGLGIVRSLGRRGIPVWVLQDEHRVGAASRYVDRRLPWPANDQGRQLDFLVDLSAREGLKKWVLFPTSDESVALVARHHDQLSQHYRLSTPPWDVVRWFCDKRLLHRMVQNLGLYEPWTFCPTSREELISYDFPFPVILKPAMRLGCNRFNSDKAWRIDDRASLVERYDEACALIDPSLIMIQELIPGGGEAQFSYAALCQDGLPIASVVARRARQFPMDFGRFSTYVETVEDTQVAESAVRLLAETRFTGLVEVEFKKDSRDGRYKILDVNPRVWGWHTLSRRSGIDFPYLVWRLANKDEVPRLYGRPGQRWIRVCPDLPMAIKEIIGGRLSVRAYLKSFRGPLESAIFAWDDPLPGFLELPLLAYLACTRLLRGHAV